MFQGALLLGMLLGMFWELLARFAKPNFKFQSRDEAVVDTLASTAETRRQIFKSEAIQLHFVVGILV